MSLAATAFLMLPEPPCPQKSLDLVWRSMKCNRLFWYDFNYLETEIFSNMVVDAMMAVKRTNHKVAPSSNSQHENLTLTLLTFTFFIRVKRSTLSTALMFSRPMVEAPRKAASLTDMHWTAVLHHKPCPSVLLTPKLPALTSTSWRRAWSSACMFVVSWFLFAKTHSPDMILDRYLWMTQRSWRPFVNVKLASPEIALRRFSSLAQTSSSAPRLVHLAYLCNTMPGFWVFNYWSLACRVLMTCASSTSLKPGPWLFAVWQKRILVTLLAPPEVSFHTALHLRQLP